MWNVRTRLGALTVVIALATTACGGGSGGDSETDAPAQIRSFTAADICGALQASDVGGALGLPVDKATESDKETPQCEYSYTNSTGATSTLTVAAMRPQDVGGKAGDDAFDFVLETNRTLASGADVDEEELSAGDRAIRLSGGSLHLGIVSARGRVLTIIVPFNDAPIPAVNALIERTAEVFG